MNIKVIIRRIVQALCALIGLLGILILIGGFALIIICLRERLFLELLLAIPAFLFSGFMITVAYQAVFRYSLKTINNISILSWFIVFGFAIAILPMPDGFRIEENPVYYAMVIMPLIIAWVAERTIKLLLRKFTVIENEKLGSSQSFHSIAGSARPE